MIEVYSFFIDSSVVVSVPMRGSDLGGAAGNETDSVSLDIESNPKGGRCYEAYPKESHNIPPYFSAGSKPKEKGDAPGIPFSDASLF